jgi:hypothetical protein
MNTLCGRFAIISATSVIVIALSGCEKRLAGNEKFELKIGGPTKDEFVDLRKPDGKKTFDDALRPLQTDRYKIRFRHDDGSIEEDYHPPRQASIQTDKVIASELANKASSEASSVNDPNVTYKISSSDPKDIKNVLDSF